MTDLSTILSPERRRDIRERAERATLPPWEAHHWHDKDEYPHTVVALDGSDGRRTIHLDNLYDADFIAESRSDTPALLSYCDEADRECQRLRAALLSILDVPQTMSQLGQLLTIQDIAKAALNAKETP